MAMKQEKEEIHVLLVAFAAQGHINPMLRLGKRLVSKGLHVTLATTQNARDRLLKSSSSTSTAESATVVSSNSVGGIGLEFFVDGYEHHDSSKFDMDTYMETLGEFGPRNLPTIIENHNPKFSCIINNPFVPWVADVAAEYGVPCATLWIQPCTLYAIYYRFYNNLNPFPTSTSADMAVDLPGLPLLQTHDLPSFVLPSNPFGSFTKVLLEFFQNINKFKWIFANSFHELEKDVIESMNDVRLHPIMAVGPLIPSALLGQDEDGLDAGIDLWKAEDTCIEWLDQNQPSSVIYVSFGSLLVLSAEEMEAIATALKRSGRPFLWVVKPPSSPVKEGDGKLPLGFSEETKKQGLVVRWSPQIEVLSHPSVGCFLTHCGWNSLLETITAGVPVIAYPQWTDQPTNAKLVSDILRIGVRLRASGEGVVSVEEVERCIEEMMGGPRSEEFKNNAAELKRAAREAVASGGSSDRNIQMFVDEINGKLGS